MEHIRPMIVRYCRARLGRAAGHYHIADDVAQEVCIAVLSALPRYQDMGRPFASFVFGIASHKMADAVRSAARLAVPTEDLPDGPDEQPGPEEIVVAYIEAQRVRELLARLPGHLRELVMHAGGDRPVGGRDGQRAGHVGRCGPRRPAPGAGQAARARGRGVDRLTLAGAQSRAARPRPWPRMGS